MTLRLNSLRNTVTNKMFTVAFSKLNAETLLDLTMPCILIDSYNANINETNGVSLTLVEYFHLLCYMQNIPKRATHTSNAK